MHFRPIERHHLAEWIDGRIESCGLIPDGVGAACVAWAGRERVTSSVSHASAWTARKSGAHVGAAASMTAFLEIIDEDADFFQTSWATLTSQKPENVLRAVAGADQGLTRKDVRPRFGLDATGTVTNTLSAFVGQDRLVRTANGSTYAFDNPYERGWLIRGTLADIGIVHVPTARRRRTWHSNVALARRRRSCVGWGVVSSGSCDKRRVPMRKFSVSSLE
jgi:hypothetical protein